MKIKINNNKGELLLDFNSETDDKEKIGSFADLTFKTLAIHMKDDSMKTCSDGIDADALDDKSIDYVEITLK